MNKEFTVNDKNYVSVDVTNQITLEAQKIKSAAFSEALNNGAPLRVEMEKELESRGLLDLDDEKRKANDLKKVINEKVTTLMRAMRGKRKMTKEEGRNLAIEIRDLREKLGDVGSNLTSYFSDTAETYANNEQLQYLLFATTLEAEEMTRAWPSFEEFKNDIGNDLYMAAMSKFRDNWLGVADAESQYPENKWLLRFGYINEDLDFIDKEGRRIDREGRLINDEGRFINEDGDFIDEFGNLVDEDGHLILEDNWDDES